jgi:hypothetical protein
MSCVTCLQITHLASRFTLSDCDFGSVEDTSRLIAAFQTNKTVTDLNIDRIRLLKGTALGNCISGLLQNNKQLC